MTFTGNVQQKQTIGKNSAGALKKPVVSSKPISSSKETKGMVKPSGHLSAKAGSRAISPHPNLNGSSNPKNQVSKLGSGLGRSVIHSNGSLHHPGINGTKAVNRGSNGVKGGNLDVVKKKDPLLNASKVGKDHQRLSGSHPTNMQKTVQRAAIMFLSLHSFLNLPLNKYLKFRFYPKFDFSSKQLSEESFAIYCLLV